MFRAQRDRSALLAHGKDLIKDRSRPHNITVSWTELLCVMAQDSCVMARARGRNVVEGNRRSPLRTRAGSQSDNAASRSTCTSTTTCSSTELHVLYYFHGWLLLLSKYYHGDA